MLPDMVMLTHDEMVSFINYKNKLEFWLGARRIALFACLTSLPLVPAIWMATNGGKLHPALVSIMILLALWTQVRLKYYQGKALELCHSIEKRNGM